MNFSQPLTGWTWGGNRMDLAVRLATGKRVLHVGCVDEGMAGRETLHQKLDRVAAELSGVDVVPGGDMIHDFQKDKWPHFARLAADQLEEAVNIYFDLVVCTEVLEHLDCVGPFLRNLRSVEAKGYLFTVPNAFSDAHKIYIEQSEKVGKASELVHPDHRCWLSPYTLENTLRRAGYEPIDKWMVGWTEPGSLFTAEGVAIFAQ